MKRKFMAALPSWLMWFAGLGLVGLILGIIFIIQSFRAVPETIVPTSTSVPLLTPTSTKTKVATLTPMPTLGVGSTLARTKDGMEMVYVPIGSFYMGSESGDSDEKPLHYVYLNAYWIDKYEVSNGQYAQCVASGQCTPPDEKSSYIRENYYGNNQYSGYPVIYVNWDQAQSYCKWVGGNLPSEAQWEKAARGDKDERIYPWGNTSPTNLLANFNFNIGDTSAAGNYPPGISPYGTMDMAGNVWEWVQDWYDADYYRISPSSDPTGPLSGDNRVVRGGSWDDGSTPLRVSNRYYFEPNEKTYFIGFRCVTDLTEEK